MVKCGKCSKVVNKKTPGLMCGKCCKWYHATCAAISVDQLTALSSTDAVDWKCRSCASSMKPKRLSYIMPDEEDFEDNTDTETTIPTATTTRSGKVSNPVQPYVKNILQELRIEVRDIIQEELQRTLKFYTDKIDEYESKLRSYENNMKVLENQCSDLRNNLKNVNMKYEVLENKVNSIEQSQLSNHIEVCGVKEKEKENIEEIVKTIATTIGQNPDDIVKAYRKKKVRAASTQNKDTPVICVTLREGLRDQWLGAAKTRAITASDAGQEGGGRVYLRESLTPATAFLLWKTKDELKELFSFIWCKNGVVLVRKNEKAKTFTVRSPLDIAKLKDSSVSTHEKPIKVK